MIYTFFCISKILKFVFVQLVFRSDAIFMADVLYTLSNIINDSGIEDSRH